MITGGLSSFIGGALTRATAELYDPATGTFGGPGTMNSARSQHSATLLPNGKVLIAGGTLNNQPLMSAELYDPATGAFTATGDLTVPRSGNLALMLPSGATLLADGRVLAVGYYTNLAALYNPVTGPMTTLARMPERTCSTPQPEPSILPAA